MDLLYSQQFSTGQTPLKKLLPILRQSSGDRSRLRKAIAGAFFKASATPEKIAGNTIISLNRHGIITPEGCLTEYGKRLVDLSEPEAAVEIARNILKTHGGFQLLETLREMRDGGHERTLVSITASLRHAGLEVSDNSSDLSSLGSWLRLAGVLAKDWDVDDARYGQLMGVDAPSIDALKDLDGNQVLFLRALLALQITHLTLYTDIVEHAERIFPGQTSFNKKNLEKDLIRPLEEAGFIQVQRAAKSSAAARGGKPAMIAPSKKFETDFAAPVLSSLFRTCKIRDLRKIRRKPWAELVSEIHQNGDINLKGAALEMLAIKICMLLGLEFIGIRQTDDNVTAGGEVDALMQSTALIFSRWQIQCKATDKITYEMVAKEFGVAAVSLASVIMVVSTGKLTPGAERYRSYLTQKTALNIIVIDGDDLRTIVDRPSAIGEILLRQAEYTRRVRDQLLPVHAPSTAPGFVQPYPDAPESAHSVAESVETPTPDHIPPEKKPDASPQGEFTLSAG